MKKKILIVGGSSGLGLELTKHYVQEGHSVYFTGRHNPQVDNAVYLEFNVRCDGKNVTEDINALLARCPGFNTLIYVAGYSLRGRIDAYSDNDIIQMTNLGLTVPALLVQRLKNKLDTPLKIMLVTSSSQYTPREQEPMYCAVKAGLGMLGASLARDPAIGKVLLVAPSGMKTTFWRNSEVNTEGMLDAKWTADRVIELSGGIFKYKFAKILRDPPRVVVEECLDNNFASIVSTTDQ